MKNVQSTAADGGQPDREARLNDLRASVSEALRDDPALLELASFLPSDARILRLACEELRIRMTLKDVPPDDLQHLRRAADFVIRAFTRSDIAVAYAELCGPKRKTMREWPADGIEVPLDKQDAAFAERMKAAGLLELQPSTRRLAVPESVRLFFRAIESRPILGKPPGDHKASVADARSILRGAASSPEKIMVIVKELKKFNEFGLARRLLAGACKKTAGIKPELLVKLRQQHALCTNKDADLPLATRLSRAIEILEFLGPLEQSTDPETLGIAGGIYKRRWEAEGQRAHLEQSLEYYLRGNAAGVVKDLGYTGINAAFIMDCLAEQEAKHVRQGQVAENVAIRRAQATVIREEIRSKLPALRGRGQEWIEKEWWFFATLAEAAFGLGHYDEANFWLVRAKEIPVLDWEYETTARQLANLARIHSLRSPAAEVGNRFLAWEDAAEQRDRPEWQAWMTIARLLGSRRQSQSKFIGKVGLALSGGGFRASLFHIGVLARLAELDLLRSVEVLSCVSGGSVIGAHYYLELRRLLTEKANLEISAEDYRDIIVRIADDFLAGVQRNIRTRVAAQFWTNLQMFWRSNYSRTHRAGELYESEIFSRVKRPQGEPPGGDLLFFHATDGYRLKIQPSFPGEEKAIEDFNPKYQNWRLAAKVPQLILNATTLNTGHNWQFTATFMGEPPGAIDTTVDGNARLRRMYYEAAPSPHSEFRLGYAVSASAGVPAIFEPLPLEGLYDHQTVRLVDGGVHDNQGVAGLFEQDTDFLIVSDASGQMGVQPSPSAGLIGVPIRSNDILMARVRTAQAHDLRARRRSGLLRGLMFLHLKKDLEADPVDWIDCADKYAASDDARPASKSGPLTSYRIRKDMQEKIAGLRTDLDSFTEAEAFALMTSGYRMAGWEYDEEIKDIGRVPLPPYDWKFLAIEKHLDLSIPNDPGAEELLKQLEVGSQLAFKVWRLSPWLRAFSWVLGIVAALSLIYGFIRWWDTVLLTVGKVGITLFVVALTAVLGTKVMRVLNFRSTFRRVWVSFVLCFGGCIVARCHLWFFDPWYLRIGKVSGLPTRRARK